VAKLVALALLLGACGRAPVDVEDDAVAQARYDRYRRPDLLIAALGLAPGATVADVGAGRGYLSGRLADTVGARGRVVALDIDGAALAELHARFPSVETRTVAPDEPALEAGAYDLVLLAEVDHLLPDRARYFARLATALAPGGRLVISNRFAYRSPAIAAAERVGLVLREESHVLPAQSLLFFSRAKEVHR
jgi:SAM-dependent methyltransferase